MRRRPIEKVLFDAFQVYGLNEASDPVVLFEYKHPRSTAPVPSNLHQFIFPESERFTPVRKFNNESFYFALSSGTQFGYCHRFLPPGSAPRLPQAIVFLSSHPFLGMFSNLLQAFLLQYNAHFRLLSSVTKGAAASASPLPSREALEAVMAPALRILSQRSFPSPGDTQTLTLPTVSALGAAPSNAGATSVGLKRSPDVHSPFGECDLACLFTALSVGDIIRCYCWTLLERPVLVVGPSPSITSGAVFALASLLAPAQWQHVFVPLLPHTLRDHAMAPVPFLMGVLEDTRQEMELHSEAATLDLVRHSFTVPSKVAPLIPKPYSGSLLNALHSIVGDARGAPRVDNARIRHAFLQFLASLFSPYRKAATPQGLNTQYFVRLHPPKSLPFFESLSQTRLFETLLHDRAACWAQSKVFQHSDSLEEAIDSLTGTNKIRKLGKFVKGLFSSSSTTSSSSQHGGQQHRSHPPPPPTRPTCVALDPTTATLGSLTAFSSQAHTQSTHTSMEATGPPPAYQSVEGVVVPQSAMEETPKAPSEPLVPLDTALESSTVTMSTASNDLLSASFGELFTSASSDGVTTSVTQSTNAPVDDLLCCGPAPDLLNFASPSQSTKDTTNDNSGQPEQSSITHTETQSSRPPSLDDRNPHTTHEPSPTMEEQEEPSTVRMNGDSPHTTTATTPQDDSESGEVTVLDACLEHRGESLPGEEMQSGSVSQTHTAGMMLLNQQQPDPSLDDLVPLDSEAATQQVTLDPSLLALLAASSEQSAHPSSTTTTTPTPTHPPPTLQYAYTSQGDLKQGEPPAQREKRLAREHHIRRMSASDVSQFGFLLLEMTTGIRPGDAQSLLLHPERAPTSTIYRSPWDPVRWKRQEKAVPSTQCVVTQLLNMVPWADIKAIIAACLRSPQLRPTMPQIVEQIEFLLSRPAPPPELPRTPNTAPRAPSSPLLAPESPLRPHSPPFPPADNLAVMSFGISFPVVPSTSHPLPTLGSPAQGLELSDLGNPGPGPRPEPGTTPKLRRSPEFSAKRSPHLLPIPTSGRSLASESTQRDVGDGSMISPTWGADLPVTHEVHAMHIQDPMPPARALHRHVHTRASHCGPLGLPDPLGPSKTKERDFHAGVRGVGNVRFHEDWRRPPAPASSPFAQAPAPMGLPIVDRSELPPMWMAEETLPEKMLGIRDLMKWKQREK
eukprot:gnl/Trimastix_PCT/5027.p1 GENE.gnl/Trimastix_PCT/5027~~gnl/Trimastix_PCT/5027.p1  ORF type:complete len:1183 (+),score=161.39 gnl/Trimastix_PCT/5027:66-3614(+)